MLTEKARKGKYDFFEFYDSLFIRYISQSKQRFQQQLARPVQSLKTLVARQFRHTRYEHLRHVPAAEPHKYPLRTMEKIAVILDAMQYQFTNNFMRLAER
jgi:hypothetical protein